MATPGISGNFAQVEAALAAIALRVEAANEAVEEAAAEVVKVAAAQLAPKLTGHMAASVDEEGGKIVVDTPYAGYVEYGSRHNKAQPFLRPAKAQSEPVVRQVAERIYTVATR
jgi:HK97 gp10 family phage protein